ncbi:hypothetical protein K7432_013350 [Basidiobolus ranarum]|uniref:cellulase n=1 Tax=Basidiobolus ranarum TaxID=34480 RepID=A0ABR2WJD2_9FUNG
MGFLGTKSVTSEGNVPYISLLGDSLLFYEAQRSGKLPPDNRIPWRHDSALDDGNSSGIDLSGGYYDAGDYVKFLFPLSYTVAVLCWGGLEFFKGYTIANEDGHFRDMIKWATDWIIKAHPSPNELYVQVGRGDIDHQVRH